MNETDARNRMLDLATEAVRLTYPDPAYLALVAPGEPPNVAASLGKASGCGLVVRGLWARLGLDDPRLRAPYSVGSVMTTIRDMANEADAWEPASALRAWIVGELDGGAYEPQEGDVLFLDAPEHVATIVKIDRDALMVYSVDGGQRIGPNEAVLRCEHPVSADASGHVLVGGTRPVLGAINLAALCAHFLPGAE